MNDASFLFDNIVFPEMLKRLESNDSVKAYKRLKRDFEDFCGKPFLRLNAGDLISFGKHRKTYCTSSSVSLYASEIFSMGYFTEMNAGELLMGTAFEHYKNPFIEAKKHFVRNYIIDEDSIPSPEEINGFILNCNELIKAVSVLILKCGLTSTDICKLNITDMNVDERNNMFIHIKSKRERYVLVPCDVKNLIENHMESFGINPDGFIFQNTRGLKLTVRTLERYYASESSRLGFNYDMKALRKAAAVYMLAGRAQMNELCDALGISTWSGFRYNRCIDRIERFTATQKSTLSF